MKKFYFLICLCISYCFSFAQGTTGHSGTGSNIDVKYHRFNWTINPDAAKNIAGTVTTYFKTTQNNVSSITFDLNKTSFNNASLIVKYHGSATGVSFSFPSSGYTDILTINLPVTLANGVLDSVSIAYSGAPPAVNSQAEGFQKKNDGTNNYIYTLSESYEDKDWWPCKADMQDKIDSTDFVITTPSAFTAITNGILVSNVVSGSNRIFTYKHRYPIASYLVSVAVAKYTVYNRGTVNIGGTNMPVEFSIFSSHGSTPTELAAMDFCKLELVAFSSKYGDYAFKNEKYGMYEFGWGGGMEHQTNSAMSFGVMSDWSVIAHELAHQWFGDKVTFATWNHLWLAEGFASYNEALAAELVPGLGQSASAVRSTLKTKANSAATQGYACVIPDTYIANSNTLWNSTYGNSVYQRGAMVVSMLRTLLGDTKFFQACRNYLSDPALAYKSAVTDDLRHQMEALAGPGAGTFDLTGFFNSFVYGTGFPTTQVKWWNPSGKVLNISIGNQTQTSAGTTTYFQNVIAIRVQGASAGQDTTIVVYDQDGDKLAKAGNGIGPLIPGDFLSYNLSFVPTTVTFDAFNQTLSKGSILKTTLLDLHVIDFKVLANKNTNDAFITLDDNSINSQVILERSGDGIHFNELGVMQVQQANQSSKKYYLQDASPLKGVNYYRAKYKNAGGQYLYSTIVKISNANNSRFSILKNPVRGNVQIKATAEAINHEFGFELYDAAGKLVLHSQNKISGDIISLNTGGLRSGVYMLKISSSEGVTETLNFVIQQ